MDTKMDINNCNINKLLLQAVEEKNVSKIHFCLISGANANYRNKDGLSPLFILATNNLTFMHISEEEGKVLASLAALLIGSGARVNDRFYIEVQDAVMENLTVLQAAAYFNNHSVVDVLLNYGAYVNALAADSGYTALHYALDTSANNTNVIERLLQESTIEVNIGCRHEGNTPLHLAVMHLNNWEKYVNLLLNRGADVQKQNRKGMTPLEHYLEHAVSFRTIHNRFRGLDSNVLNVIPPSHHSDISPLSQACLSHRINDVRKLAMNMTASEINSRDKFGHTPLFYTVMAWPRYESDTNKNATLELLLNLGADISLEYGGGQRSDPDPEEGDYHILDIAILLGDRESSRSILQHMAKLMSLHAYARLKDLRKMNLDLIYRRDHNRKKIDLWKHYAKCRRELRAMKRRNVGKSQTTFFQLLTAKVDKALVYSKHKKLVKAFEIGMQEFPIYKETIRYTNIGIAVERRKLTDDTAMLLSELLQFAEPRHVFYEKTLAYLDIDELKFLNNSFYTF